MFKEVKEIGKHFSIYGTAAILTRVAGFLLIPIYTRFLTPADYGIANFVQMIFYILSSVLGLHLVDGMMRFYYEQEEEREKIIGTAFGVTWFMITIILVVFGLFSRKIALLSFGKQGYGIFFIISAVTLCSRFNNSLVGGGFRIRKESLKVSLFSLTNFIVSVGTSVYLIAVLKKGVLGFFIGAASGTVLVSILYLPQSIKGLRGGFSKECLKKLLKFSGPLIFSGFLFSLMYSADKFLIKRYLTLSALGIYSLAFSFGVAIQQIITFPLGNIWGPYVYSNLESPTIKKFISRFSLLVLGVVSFVCFTSSIFVKDIIKIVANETFWEAAKIAPFAIVYFCIGTFLVVPSIGIGISKKTHYWLWLNLVLVLVLTISNILMLPKIGIVGAGIALLITAFVRVVLVLYFSNKGYPIRYNYGKMFLMSSVTAVFIVTGLNINAGSMRLDFLCKILLVGLYVLAFFMFKLVSVRDIKYYLGVIFRIKHN